jgi:HTH-type transcriptional regulator/antitoxin HigA
LKEYIPADHNMYGETAEPAASRPEEERIVNALATETLVPKSEMDDFIARVGPLFYTIKIRNFASRIHVHPGIVVGQLQHRGKLDWSQNRELLAKVRQFVFGAALTDGWSRAVPITA